jgi:hypothetical protein
MRHSALWLDAFLSVDMLNEVHYAECRYAKCLTAECRGAYLSVASLTSLIKVTPRLFELIHKLRRKWSYAKKLLLPHSQNFIFRNIRMGPISWRVTLYCAWKACQGQIIYLVGPIRKLRRKWSVVNTTLILWKIVFCHTVVLSILSNMGRIQNTLFYVWESGPSFSI